jgi:hypothetical protein
MTGNFLPHDPKKLHPNATSLEKHAGVATAHQGRCKCAYGLSMHQHRTCRGKFYKSNVHLEHGKVIDKNNLITHERYNTKRYY